MNARKHRIKRKLKKSSGILAVILIVLLTCYFFSMALHYHSVTENVRRGNPLNYSGSYTLEEVHRIRNTVYVFTLDNGEKVSAAPEWIENSDQLELHPKLHFSYSESQFGTPQTHTATQIVSLDGSVHFLTKDRGENQAGGYMVLGFLGAAAGFFLTMLLILPPKVVPNTVRRLRGVSKRRK